MVSEEEMLEATGNVTNAEELKFIFQAALAPLSIAKRIFIDHETVGSALLQTIDRVKYVTALRKREQKRPVSP